MISRSAIQVLNNQGLSKNPTLLTKRATILPKFVETGFEQANAYIKTIMQHHAKETIKAHKPTAQANEEFDLVYNYH